MKNNVYIEYGENQIRAKDLTDKVKEMYKQNGYKVKDIHSLDVYYKPAEGMCYYVINDNDTGSFAV